MTKEKKDILNRLKTLQGHLGGIITMIEEEKECEEILLQMKAVASSVAKTQSLIFQHYLHQCAKLPEEDQAKIKKALNMIL